MKALATIATVTVSVEPEPIPSTVAPVVGSVNPLTPRPERLTLMLDVKAWAFGVLRADTASAVSISDRHIAGIFLLCMSRAFA